MSELEILYTIKESLKYSRLKIENYTYPPGCNNNRREKLSELGDAENYISDKIKQLKPIKKNK